MGAKTVQEYINRIVEMYDDAEKMQQIWDERESRCYYDGMMQACESVLLCCFDTLAEEQHTHN